MKFMFDANLSTDLAKAIGALSRKEHVVERVMHVEELFPKNTDDVVWIGRLKEHGAHWVVITNDKLKKQQGSERALINRSEFIGYVLDPQWGHHGFWSIAERLVDWWPIILEHVKTARAGLYRVPWKTGSARRLTSF
ncbi:hypothetical protein CDN99_20360 [Roseateles aquatilis]|uniref:VapC45 PIN like domain-containing protein n=1 Tax=Roseateles aquatilis TaxID=431061 RepID=A0A246J0V5_9BURK|nr:hypothetical protein [Roseateles aquatilis]OWQ86195.1 hypothetical protein CDN99_20360 [Roseateles aquatilis]